MSLLLVSRLLAELPPLIYNRRHLLPIFSTSLQGLRCRTVQEVQENNDLEYVVRMCLRHMNNETDFIDQFYRNSNGYDSSGNNGENMYNNNNNNRNKYNYNNDNNNNYYNGNNYNKNNNQHYNSNNNNNNNDNDGWNYFTRNQDKGNQDNYRDWTGSNKQRNDGYFFSSTYFSCRYLGHVFVLRLHVEFV